jgi:hypothetical protein
MPLFALRVTGLLLLVGALTNHLKRTLTVSAVLMMVGLGFPSLFYLHPNPLRFVVMLGLAEAATFDTWSAHLSLPVRPAHHVHRVRQHDPATACPLAQRRIAAIYRPIKDRVLAMLAIRGMVHVRERNAAHDRVLFRVSDHWVLLPRSGLLLQFVTEISRSASRSHAWCHTSGVLAFVWVPVDAANPKGETLQGTWSSQEPGCGGGTVRVSRPFAVASRRNPGRQPLSSPSGWPRRCPRRAAGRASPAA